MGDYFPTTTLAFDSQPTRPSQCWALDTTVSGKLGLDTRALSRGEVVHAAIVGVVHEVVDTVEPIRVREYVTFEGGRS